MIPDRFLDLVDCEQPLYSKTILNSRVLRYGQLNGHVASIVSMFSKEKVLKRNVLVKRWKEELIPERYG